MFTYDPATDTPALLGSDDWPGDAGGTILPGGFTVANNKLYIVGGFNINVASTNEIWEFNPNAAAGSRWTQKVNAPEGIMYASTCTINGIIYVGGASDFQGGTVVDTTNSFSFDPVANTIGTIAAIPRATGETRGLNFNGQMYVMGGGRARPIRPTRWTSMIQALTLGQPATHLAMPGGTSQPIPTARPGLSYQVATMLTVSRRWRRRRSSAQELGQLLRPHRHLQSRHR